MHDIVIVGIQLIAILASVLIRHHDINGLRSEMSGLFGTMGRGFARIGSRFDRIDARMAELNALIGKLIGRVEIVEKRV